MSYNRNSVVRTNDFGVRRWNGAQWWTLVHFSSVWRKFWITLNTTENQEFSRASKDLIGLTKSNIVETANHSDVIFPSSISFIKGESWKHILCNSKSKRKMNINIVKPKDDKLKKMNFKISHLLKYQNRERNLHLYIYIFFFLHKYLQTESNKLNN